MNKSSQIKLSRSAEPHQPAGLKYSLSVHISTQYMQIPFSQTQIQEIQSGKKDKLHIISVHLKTPSIRSLTPSPPSGIASVH